MKRSDSQSSFKLKCIYEQNDFLNGLQRLHATYLYFVQPFLFELLSSLLFTQEQKNSELRHALSEQQTCRREVELHHWSHSTYLRNKKKHSPKKTHSTKCRDGIGRAPKFWLLLANNTIWRLEELGLEEGNRNCFVSSPVWKMANISQQKNNISELFNFSF